MRRRRARLDRPLLVSWPSPLAISHPVSPPLRQQSVRRCSNTFLRVNQCFPFLVQPLDVRAAVILQQTHRCSHPPCAVSCVVLPLFSLFTFLTLEVGPLAVFTYCMFPLPRKPAEPLLCKHSQAHTHTHTHTHTRQTGRPYLFGVSWLGTVR